MKIIRNLTAVLLLTFTIGQVSYGQTLCNPTFYVLEEGETMPVISTKDTTLTIKYNFPNECSTQEIIIDSTATSPLGVICLRYISIGNQFTPYVLSCLKTGQNTTKKATVIVYYHYKKSETRKMGAFNIKL